VGGEEEALRGKGVAVGSFQLALQLFTIEVTLDKTVENWYQFMKPIHCIKNLLTVKKLLNVVSSFTVIIFPSGRYSEECFL
jgi:hypothetical protein